MSRSMVRAVGGAREKKRAFQDNQSEAPALPRTFATSLRVLCIVQCDDSKLWIVEHRTLNRKKRYILFDS